MTLNDLQYQVDQWIKTYGVKYFHQLTNLGILTEEIGELSRYLVRIYGEQSFKKEIDQQTAKQKLAEELGDVLFVLTCLANQCDINLEEVMDQNLKKKTTRDSDRHFRNEKLKRPEPGSDSIA